MIAWMLVCCCIDDGVWTVRSTMVNKANTLTSRTSRNTLSKACIAWDYPYYLPTL